MEAAPAERDELESLLPTATTAHTASIRIRASPEAVWRSLHEITVLDCWITAALVVARSLPALITRRGALGDENPASLRTPLLDDMSSGRFAILRCDPPHTLVLGIIGRFWELTGGTDVDVDGVARFVDFERPGYVKTAMSFTVDTVANGSRLTTQTRNQPTDRNSAQRFHAYWRLIGPVSRLTRVERLHAVRRRAHQSVTDRESGNTG